jgi:hypothetical protein
MSDIENEYNDDKKLLNFFTISRKVNEQFNYIENTLSNLTENLLQLKKTVSDNYNQKATNSEMLRLKLKIQSYKQLINDNSNNINNDVLCILCNDNQRNVLFRPCNHLVICDVCSGQTDFKECIICKQEIHSYEYAYLV